MDKQKLEAMKAKLKEKAENALTKAYVFAQEHPIITAVTTTVAGSVITGAVAYKVGESKGVTGSAHELLDGAKGYHIVVKGVESEGKAAIDMPLAEAMNEFKYEKQSALFGGGVCALTQVLPEGFGLLVGHTVGNEYEVRTCEWIPDDES